MPLPGVPVLPPQGLVDGRVRLRALAMTDVGLVRELSREYDVVRWTTYPPDLDDKAAEARIAWTATVADQVLSCVVELEGRPAGTCGAGLGSTEGTIEMFYAILPWARRQGVASTALSLLVSAARAAGAGSVGLETHVDNIGSQMVAQRAGFVNVGVAAQGPPRQWSIRLWSGLNPLSTPHSTAWVRLLTLILR